MHHTGVSRNESESAASLRAFLGRLVTRYVRPENWTNSEDMGNNIPERMLMTEGANIVTSQLRPDISAGGDDNRHALLLDLDHPSWLVKSTTPGHFHLYVDVPGGISHETYLHLIDALADAGVIQRGYAHGVEKRGFSALRLPWIKKESVA